MLLLWGFVVSGLALLFLGGELVVRGSIWLARALGVSVLFISLVVVAIGTSAPEFVVSVQAALDGEPDIAVGNVLGSNIANILLILGLTALVRPISAQRLLVFRDLTVLGIVSGGFALFAFNGTATLQGGLALLGGLAAYILYTFFTERENAKANEDIPDHVGAWRVFSGILLLAGGFAALIMGSRLLIDGAAGLAQELGVGPSVIALTVVAVGTSLPELAATLAAALRRQTDIVVGTVIGSNVFNLLGAIGATAVIAPFQFNTDFLVRDVWVMLGAVAVLVPTLIMGGKLTRWEAVVFLALYGGYCAVLYGLIASII